MGVLKPRLFYFLVVYVDLPYELVISVQYSKCLYCFTLLWYFWYRAVQFVLLPCMYVPLIQSQKKDILRRSKDVFPDSCPPLSHNN